MRDKPLVVSRAPKELAVASLYQRGKRRIWWIKYYVNGRPVYRSLHTTNARVAERIKKQIEGNEAKGELLAPSRTPLPNLLEDYCRFMATYRTRKSCSTDVSILRIVFGPITPALELGSHVNRRCTDAAKRLPDTLTRRHIRAKHLEDVTGRMLEDFITTRIREDGISPKTANRTREVQHKLFNYATRKWNLVAPDRRHPNPAALVQRRSEPPSATLFERHSHDIHDTPHVGTEVPVLVVSVRNGYGGLYQDRESAVEHQEVVVALDVLNAVSQLRFNILLHLMHGEKHLLVSRIQGGKVFRVSGRRGRRRVSPQQRRAEELVFIEDAAQRR